MRFFVSGILVILMVSTCVLAAAPKPAIVQTQGNWTVEVTFEHPEQISINRSGQAERYWYVIVSLVNKTGDDVEFYPKCELMTDTFQIIPAQKAASPALVEKIKARHASKYPFLEPLGAVGNSILEGDDNAVDIILIFPDFDSAAKSVKVFVSGLSNETAMVRHPKMTDADGEPVNVFLRKTLELNYQLGGDEAFRGEQSLDYQSKRWVMR